MGIYGMGKAFNLRYVNSGQFRSPHVRFRQPSRPMFGGNVTYTENTNVTIKNGPSGFWGFLGGLFSGLFGGGMFGGLFGGGMNMNMGMNMGMGGMSPFGMLNTQMSQPTGTGQKTDELGNLKKMYSKYEVLPNGNGTYTLTTGKGDNVKTGTYDELMKGLDSNPEPETKVKDDKNKKPTNEVEPQGKPDGTVTSQKPEENQNNDLAKEFSKYKGTMNVHDEVRGSQYDINGTSSASSEKAKSGYPQIITVKGNRYEFQRMEDGKAIYKSLDGAGDEYRLEKNANGKFALNQYEGDKGAGTADISSNRKVRQNAPASSPAAAQSRTLNEKGYTVDPKGIKILGNTAEYIVYREPPLTTQKVTVTINPGDAWTETGKQKIANQIQAKINSGDFSDL